MHGTRRSEEFVIDFSALPLEPDLRRLIEQEKEEFEAVLGRAVAFRPADAADDAWVIEPPDDPTTPPRLRWKSPGRLTSVAGSVPDFLATMNALHSLSARQLEDLSVEPARSAEEAVEIIRAEIANTYPSFALRGLDWDEICSRHLPERPDGSDSAAFADFTASWIAELGDAHTAIRTSSSSGYAPPYRGTLEADGVRLTSVPRGSAAWEAGVRPGWVVEVNDIARFIRTVGATPQQLPQVRARRALAMTGERRNFRARGASGRVAEWEEVREPATAENTAIVEGDRGDRIVRLHAFDARIDLHAVFDEVIADGAPSDRITIDLRGNTGGSILLATDLRDRFLRRRTHVGYVAFTDGRGGIAPKNERWADPSARTCWPGHVDVLIDGMTYSASEDFVLGLQGLEHVRVQGSVSGGGSGRPRRIPLLPGVDLTVSTAITYDRRGEPVEYRGVRPDLAGSGAT